MDDTTVRLESVDAIPTSSHMAGKNIEIVNAFAKSKMKYAKCVGLKPHASTALNNTAKTLGLKVHAVTRQKTVYLERLQ